MKPDMTEICSTIEDILNQDDLDPGMAVVYGYLWDFTTDRDKGQTALVKECESLIAGIENFRRYLENRISLDALMGKE